MPLNPYIVATCFIDLLQSYSKVQIYPYYIVATLLNPYNVATSSIDLL